MKIWLLRHGRTIYNDQRRYQGLLDIPLSPEGKAELFAADISPEIVYVSPLRRTQQTAERIFPGVPQEIVMAFAEMDFGLFDGRTADEMAEDADYRAWVDGGCHTRCPGGESRAAFCDRTCTAFEQVLLKCVVRKAEMLVIVAHGGTLRAVMERYALPERDYFDWTTRNGSGYLLEWDEALWGERRKLRYWEALCFAEGTETC